MCSNWMLLKMACVGQVEEALDPLLAPLQQGVELQLRDELTSQTLHVRSAIGNQVRVMLTTQALNTCNGLTCSENSGIT